MAADLVTIIETVAITQFLTPAAKSIGEAARDQAQRVSKAAVQILANVGRTPQPVEPKLFVPLIQASALETDESLATKWAALLANAADPAQTVQHHPAFVEILKQLTAAEAQLLDELFDKAEHLFKSKPGLDRILEKESYRKRAALDYALDLDSIYSLKKRARRAGKGALELADRQRFDAMIDVFLRHQIIILARTQPSELKESLSSYEPDKGKVFFTSLGYDFLRACMVPQ